MAKTRQRWLTGTDDLAVGERELKTLIRMTLGHETGREGTLVKKKKHVLLGGLE